MVSLTAKETSEAGSVCNAAGAGGGGDKGGSGVMLVVPAHVVNGHVARPGAVWRKAHSLAVVAQPRPILRPPVAHDVSRQLLPFVAVPPKPAHSRHREPKPNVWPSALSATFGNYLVRHEARGIVECVPSPLPRVVVLVPNKHNGPVCDRGAVVSPGAHRKGQPVPAQCQSAAKADPVMPCVLPRMSAPI